MPNPTTELLAPLDAEAANAAAVERLFTAEPVLVDVRPAIDAIPGMRRDLDLTSGPTMPWSEYTGGQRTAILGSVEYEGLAPDPAAAQLCSTAAQ